MANLGHGLTESYFSLAREGTVFTAYATAITPTVYTATTLATLLLWNGGNKKAILFGLSAGITTASGVACQWGIAGGSQQPAAPTSTTAITISGNTLGNTNPSTCTVYKAGTVAAAANYFMPFVQINTGAITLADVTWNWVSCEGAIVVPPSSWIAICSSATPTSAVAGLGLMWGESQV